MDRKISLVVIRRLPRYYRYLGELLNQNITRISSKELSEKMNVTASQIRQDLNCFGGFGQQGYGYNVPELHQQIGLILGVNKTQNIIIIGAGNLGQALANHAGFSKRGFSLTAIFDTDINKIGAKINGVEVLSLDTLGKYLDENEIKIAILTLPKQHTQKVADLVISHGVRGLWNFSHMDLKVPEDVFVENVHLTDSLMTLSYQLNEKE